MSTHPSEVGSYVGGTVRISTALNPVLYTHTGPYSAQSEPPRRTRVHGDKMATNLRPATRIEQQMLCVPVAKRGWSHETLV